MGKYNEWNRCRFCGAHIADPCDNGCAASDDTPEVYGESLPDSVPCTHCGAGPLEPCREGCVMLTATPWETHAAAWDSKPW